MSRLRCFVAGVATLVAVLLTSSSMVRLACAQGAARSLDIDPSARAGGMGGASAAVAWGAPNLWANPAFVAARSGVLVEVHEQRLVPGLAEDVHHSTTRLAASALGLGISMTGRPLGGTLLDYGIVEPLWPSTPYVSTERMRGWGFGASAGAIADLVMEALGHRARPGRSADLSFGRQWKDVRVDFGGGVVDETSTFDQGWLARVAIVDNLREEAPEGARPWRIELAFGQSVLHGDDAKLVFFSTPSPLSRLRREGIAARWVVGPGRAPDLERSRLRRWLRADSEPTWEVTLAFDNELVTAGDDDSSENSFEAKHMGAEAVGLGVLAARLGRMSDPDGEIEAMTWGLGLRLPVGRHADVRYDWASWPQARGIDERVNRHSVVVHVDPLGAMRHRGLR